MNSITVTQTDTAGNTSSASTALSVTIDTSANAPNQPDLQAASDSGGLNNDNITNDTTPTFDISGAEAGATVTIAVTGATTNTNIGTATADGSGNASVTVSALSPGVNSITVTQTDASGNTSSASTALSVTIDTSANAPNQPDLQAASDTGSSSTDNITNDTTPTFDISGAEAGATVTIAVTGATTNTNIGTATADGSGNASVTVSALSPGVNSITVTQTDAAGNTSSASTALSVTIDTSPPMLAQVTAVTTPTVDTTPDYSFSTTETGILSVGGSCGTSTSTTISTTGSQTITLTATDNASPLSAGTFSDCTVTVTDTAGNASTPLAINSFQVIGTTPPGFTKAFNPTSVVTNAPAQLTFTIDNTANLIAATGVNFTDPLPTNLVVASPAAVNNTCTGGTVTANPGSNSITYSGGQVLASASCTISVNVTSAVAGAFNNTTGNLTSSLGTSTPATASLTVNAQEIDVQRPAGTSIADGGTDAQAAPVAGSPVTITYTIANTGTATLNLTGTPTAAALNNVAVNTITAPGVLAVPAGGTTTFSVTYTPAAAGAFSFELDILSDDGDEATYDITASGTATAAPAPEIEIAGSIGGAVADGGVLDQANQAVGTQQTVTFTVSNIGQAALTLSGSPIAANPTNVTVNAISAPVSALVAANGGTTTFTVQYTPTANGAFSFELDVNSNDVDENPYDILVSGTGAGAVPDIEVQASIGGAVADGGTLAQGDQQLGVQQALEFTITNTGLANLILNGTPNSSNPSNVTVDSISAPGSTTIAGSGGTTTFTVTYTPGSTLGDFSFELDIASNDPDDESTYDITVSGTVIPGLPSIVVVVSGSDQFATLGTSFEAPLVANVTDASGNLVPGATVSLVVPETGASAALTSPTTTSDANGQISVPVTANGVEGTYTVVASVENGTADGSFTLTNSPDQIAITTDGEDQDVPIFSEAPEQFEVTVTNSSGAPVSGVNVTFTAPESGPSGTFQIPSAQSSTVDLGGGSVAVPVQATTASTTAKVATNENGVATSPVFVANGEEGNYTITVTAPNLPPLSIAVSNTAPNPSAVTITSGSDQSAQISTQFEQPLVATVVDEDGGVIGGIEVTFTAPTDGASLTFASTGTNTETVTTASNGQATSSLMTANSVSSNYVGSPTLQPYTVVASSPNLASANFTLTNGRDREADIRKTQDVIANFVTNRADRIVAEQPDLTQRLTGGTFGGEGNPLGFAAEGSLDQITMSFQTSLRALNNIRAARVQSLEATGPDLDRFKAYDSAGALGYSPSSFANLEEASEVAFAAYDERDPAHDPSAYDGQSTQAGYSGTATRSAAEQATGYEAFGARSRGRESANRAGRSRHGRGALALFPQRTSDDAASAADELADGDDLAHSSDPVDQAFSGFDIWTKGTYAYQENGTTRSEYGLFFVGADYRFGDRAVLGVMGQIDIADETDIANGTAVNGVGWMVGPYAVVRLHQNLIADARITYGWSDNNVNALGLFYDDFQTDRLLIQGGLTGDFKLGPVTFNPLAKLTYFTEEQKSYVDSLGNLIPSQRFNLGRLEFGPRVGMDMRFENGFAFAPYVSLTGVWDFNQLQDRPNNTSALASAGEPLRARVEGGASATLPIQDITLGLEGFYDGIGINDYEAYGVSGEVRVPF